LRDAREAGEPGGDSLLFGAGIELVFSARERRAARPDKIKSVETAPTPMAQTSKRTTAMARE
jgi:hypothetical protein